jgi:hypothetical protein
VIVVDASVLANVVGDDSTDGHLARQRMGDEIDVATPDLADVEQWPCRAADGWQVTSPTNGSPTASPS